jgi:hypothetical protein
MTNANGEYLFIQVHQGRRARWAKMGATGCPESLALRARRETVELQESQAGFTIFGWH